MGEKKMIQKNYYKPFQQKCNNTKCDKPALTENKINVGNRTLYYCNKHFQEIRSDLKRPTGYPNGPKDWKNKPRATYCNPTPPTTKKWNQPTPADKHKIETRRTAWEKEFIKFAKERKQKKEAKAGK